MNCHATTWAAALVAVCAVCGASEVEVGAERLAEAQQQWELLQAKDYSYDLDIGIGAPFGYGEFHVKVRDGKCIARHYGGGGLGRPKLMDRLRYKSCQEGFLPSELMDQVAHELANGRQLVQLSIHPKYAFVVGATTDSDKLLDASWGFKIREFRVEAHR